MWKKILLLFSASFILLSACGTLEVSVDRAPSPAVGAGGVAASVGVTPAAFPSVTPASLPSLAPVLQPSPTELLPAVTLPQSDAAAAPQMVSIFLIALQDDGQTGSPVGCGDSAIPVQVEVPSTRGVLKAALESLLALKAQFHGESGLYNALYRSDLTVESVDIQAGHASVYLTGSLLMGGECDGPRVKAQLEQTVLQFTTVTDASIFINGQPLDDALWP